MRTIKFRAWDDRENSKAMLQWLHISQTALNRKDYPLMYEVFTMPYFIKMQFTEFQDENKKEIYEGDVIEFEEPRLETGLIICEVVFYDGAFVAQWERDHRTDYIPLFEIEEPRILGNVYENPELLKN